MTVESMNFLSADGIELAGELRGRGDRGVILSHAAPEDRSSWAEPAELLAEEGYLVLAFDQRGVGDSRGERDLRSSPQDVLGAIEALRARGAGTVVLVGASAGGTASLVAATEAQVDGVVTLSAPATFEGLAAGPEILAAVDEPKLFLAAEGDGSAPEAAQTFYEQASGAKRIEIVTGDEHGAEMLEGGQAEVVRMHLLRFLDANA